MRIWRHKHNWSFVRFGGEWREDSYWGCTECRKTMWIKGDRRVFYGKRDRKRGEVFPWERTVAAGQETET